MNKCNSHNRKHTGMFISDKTKAKNLKLENVVQQGNGALFGVNFSKKVEVNHRLPKCKPHVVYSQQSLVYYESTAIKSN